MDQSYSEKLTNPLEGVWVRGGKEPSRVNFDTLGGLDKFVSGFRHLESVKFSNLGGVVEEGSCDIVCGRLNEREIWQLYIPSSVELEGLTHVQWAKRQKIVDLHKELALRVLGQYARGEFEPMGVEDGVSVAETGYVVKSFLSDGKLQHLLQTRHGGFALQPGDAGIEEGRGNRKPVKPGDARWIVVEEVLSGHTPGEELKRVLKDR